jgi:Holliday junction DNA helicase RuvA
MIGYLKGKVLSKKPTKLLIDVNGVGYLVNISISTFEKIAEMEEVALYTYLAVRESALDLFGFYSLAEKEMFEVLIGVNGIGPKSAQGILSGIQIADLKEAVKTGNISRLVSIPGIGKKTAERMLIEIRDKVDSVADTGENILHGSSSVRGDAIAALVNLGYNQKTAERIVQAVLDKNPNSSIEDLIKNSLSALNS